MAWTAYPILAADDPIVGSHGKVMSEIYDALDERCRVAGQSPLTRVDLTSYTAIANIRLKIEDLFPYFWNHEYCSADPNSPWVKWSKSSILTAYHGTSTSDWISAGADGIPSAAVVNEIQGVLDLLRWLVLYDDAAPSSITKRTGSANASTWDEAWTNLKAEYPESGTPDDIYGFRCRAYSTSSLKYCHADYKGCRRTFTRPNGPLSGLLGASDIAEIWFQFRRMEAMSDKTYETNEIAGVQRFRSGAGNVYLDSTRQVSGSVNYTTEQASAVSPFDDDDYIDYVPCGDPSGSGLDPYRPATPSTTYKWTVKGFVPYSTSFRMAAAIKFTHRTWT